MPVLAPPPVSGEQSPYEWLGRVLTHCAEAEQALVRLCVELGLPIEKGSLSRLADLRRKLAKAGGRRCKLLDDRIARWSSSRPIRNLLAHATLHELTDRYGALIIVTRHLPRDQDDVTPDRMWTKAERDLQLKQARSDGRSICDLVANLLSDPECLKRLRDG